jgi:hypothetical protein
MQGEDLAVVALHGVGGRKKEDAPYETAPEIEICRGGWLQVFLLDAEASGQNYALISSTSIYFGQ